MVIFDGATGTNLQLRHLGPDDFGGAALEGCNEILVRHPARRDRGPAPILLRRRLRRGGNRQLRLPSLGAGRVRAGRRGPASWPPSGAHRPRGGGPGGYAGPVGRRLARPRDQDRLARPDHLRRSARRLPGGGRRPSRRRGRPFRHRDGPGPAAGQGGDRRLPSGHGRGRPGGPHPGPGDHRDNRPDADGHRDRRRPHHPRRPAPRRHRPQLRHRAGRDERAPALPVAARPGCRSPSCPTPACPRSWRARCTTT